MLFLNTCAYKTSSSSHGPSLHRYVGGLWLTMCLLWTSRSHWSPCHCKVFTIASLSLLPPLSLLWHCPGILVTFRLGSTLQEQVWPQQLTNMDFLDIMLSVWWPQLETTRWEREDRKSFSAGWQKINSFFIMTCNIFVSYLHVSRSLHREKWQSHFLLNWNCTVHLLL